jgi:hypothetical protein
MPYGPRVPERSEQNLFSTLAETTGMAYKRLTRTILIPAGHGNTVPFVYRLHHNDKHTRRDLSGDGKRQRPVPD